MQSSMQNLPTFAYQLQGDQAEDNFVRIGVHDKTTEPKKVVSGLLKNFYSTHQPFQDMKDALADAGVAIGADDFSSHRLSALQGTSFGGAYISGSGCIVIHKSLATEASLQDMNKLINLLVLFPHEMTHAAHDCAGLMAAGPDTMDKTGYIQNFMATEAAAYANTIMAHWYLTHEEPLAEQVPHLQLIWPSIEKADPSKMDAGSRGMHEARMAFSRAAGNETSPEKLKGAWKAAFRSFFCENEYLPRAYLKHMSANFDRSQAILSGQFNEAARHKFTAARLGAFIDLPGLKVEATSQELEDMLAANTALLARPEFKPHTAPASGPAAP